MNTDSKHTAQQLRLAADILETEHLFEFGSGTTWNRAFDSTPFDCLKGGYQVRPILATPPDGRPLHNPDNLTAEQVGVGYCLALKGEPTNSQIEQQEYWSRGGWVKSGKVYTDTFDGSLNARITYRLPLSVPWPDAPDAKDPYAELKAARAQGKRIQCKLRMGCGWTDYTGDFSNADSRHEFRVVEAATHRQMEPRRLGALQENHHRREAMSPIIFFAPGIPKGQPRVRAFVRGRHAGVYDPGTADDFKAAIYIAAKRAIAAYVLRPVLDCPVKVDCEFVFPRPKSHFTAKGQIKATAPIWHTQKPDRDNLDKAVLDTLTKVQMWADDCQVCSGSLVKRWAALGEASGVQITITAIAS